MRKELIWLTCWVVLLSIPVYGESSSSSSSISGSWSGTIPGGKLMKTFFSGPIKYVEFELKETTHSKMPIIHEFDTYSNETGDVANRTVYDYFEIFWNVEDENVEIAEIKIEVYPVLLGSKNLTILRYSNDSWNSEDITIEFFEDQSNIDYYLISVPNYGHFAIVEYVEEIEEDIWSKEPKIINHTKELELVGNEEVYKDKIILSKVWLVILFIFIFGYYISKKKRRKA